MSTTSSVDEKTLEITVGEHRQMCTDLDVMNEKNEELERDLGEAKGAAITAGDTVTRILGALYPDEIEMEEWPSTGEIINEISRLQIEHSEAVRKAEGVLRTNETLGEVNAKLTKKIAGLELQQGQAQGTIKRLERELEVEASRQKKLDRLENFLEEARHLVIELGADDRRAGDEDEGS